MNKQLFNCLKKSSLQGVRNFSKKQQRSLIVVSNSINRSYARGNTSKGYNLGQQDPTPMSNQQQIFSDIPNSYDSANTPKQDNIFARQTATNMPSDNVGYSTQGLEDKGAKIPSPDMHKPQNPYNSSNAAFSSSMHYGANEATVQTSQSNLGKEHKMKEVNDREMKQNVGEFDTYDPNATIKSSESHKKSWEHDKKKASSTAKEVKDSITSGTEKLSEKVRDYADKASQSAEKAKSKAKASVPDSITEKASEWKDTAKEKLHKAEGNVAAKAEDWKDSAWETAQNAKENIKEKASEWKDTAKEKLHKAEGYTAAKAEDWKDSAWETAQNVKENVKEKASEWKDTAKEKLHKAEGYTAAKAEDLKASVWETAQHAKENVQEKAKDAKDMASDTVVNAKEKIQDTAENLSEKTQGAKEYMEEKAYNAAKGTYEFVKDAAKYGLGKMGEGMEKVGHVMKETFQEGEHQQAQQREQHQKPPGNEFVDQKAANKSHRQPKQ